MGVAGRGNPHLKWLALVIPYAENPKERFDTVFSLGTISINKLTFSHPLGVAGRGNPPPKIAGISQSGNGMGTFDTVLALAPFP